MEVDQNTEFGRDRLRPPGSPPGPPVIQENTSKNFDSRLSQHSDSASLSPKRAKSSLRLRYEAETQVIQRKLGDLESIREKLGLSQRKMAQLLLVDPSAWTRWTKGDDQAPPHIFRMLQWYLALEEKYPALDVNFWLNTVAQTTEKSSALQKIEPLRRDVTSLSVITSSQSARIEALAAELKSARRKSVRWLVGLFFLGVLGGFVNCLIYVHSLK